MSENSSVPGLSNVVDRLTGLVTLLTTLDTRIITTLDSIGEMQKTVAGFEALGPQGDALIDDLRQRIETTDERLQKDLDDIKAAIMDKIGEVDLAGLGPRFDRLEKAILNIERATVNLDQAVEGGLEALPDFMSRKIKGEAKKKSKSKKASNEVAPLDGA